jgi:hypothetical protein
MRGEEWEGMEREMLMKEELLLVDITRECFGTVIHNLKSLCL